MTQPICRSCGERLDFTVVDLGQQPLANRYLRPDQVATEYRYPLHARLCETCGLVQVDDVVPAAEIFEDYAYFSSVSSSWLDHARRFAGAAIDRLDLGSDDLVVEVASNDGYLLRWFVERNIRVLGVEPAQNITAVAEAAGVPTLARFFGRDVAEQIRSDQGAARLIVGNNVLAHVPDLNDFVAGLAALLADDGAISIEVPHLLNLIEKTQFDTIYHEHYSYFSLMAATAVFGRHGLRVVEVDELPTHGGSLRLWIGHATADLEADSSVGRLLEVERQAALDRPEGYVKFAAAVEGCRDGLIDYLATAATDGRTVVGYGAAAKGNTLLNYAAVTSDQLGYVVDRSPHKQGLLLPGTHLPILHPDQIAVDRPGRLLILPWNLRDEIAAQMAGIRAWGGAFATAVPTMVEF